MGTGARFRRTWRDAVDPVFSDTIDRTSVRLNPVDDILGDSHRRGVGAHEGVRFIVDSWKMHIATGMEIKHI